MTIDYIAGIGIFLLSVVFVFQFVSGLFIPFQSGSDKAALAADRAATLLVEQMLHADTSGALNVIDQSKLYNFNNTQLNYSNKTSSFVPCAGKSMGSANYNNALCSLGLFIKQTFFDMNVTVAYLNGTVMNQSFTYPNGTVSDMGLPLVCGAPVPENTDIAQTKRLVLIINSSSGYNQTAILSVRVW